MNSKLAASCLFAGALGRVLWGAVTDHVFEPRMVLAALGLVMALCAFAVALFTADWPPVAVFAVCVLYGATAVGWNGVFLAEVARLAPEGRVAIVTGGTQFFTFAGVLIGPFGGGMYTDLFVHQTTHMISAMGVKYPARVVGGGGLYLEYDGRDVPDVAAIVADYEEGCQLVIMATMINDYPIEEVIRGKLATIKFATRNNQMGYEVLPQNISGGPGRPRRLPRSKRRACTWSATASAGSSCCATCSAAPTRASGAPCCSARRSRAAARRPTSRRARAASCCWGQASGCGASRWMFRSIPVSKSGPSRAPSRSAWDAW